MYVLSNRPGPAAGINPLVTMVVTDTALPEPPFVADGWFPAKFWAANRFGDQERLVIIGGQYNRDGSVERLYRDLVLESYYSTNTTDYLPPTIWDTSANPAPGGVEFTVDAEDFDSGVQRVLVTIHAPNGKGGGVWYSLELQLDDITGMWRRFVPGLDAASLQYLVQAMDWAGNVTVTNNKGAFYGAIREVFLPLVMRN